MQRAEMLMRTYTLMTAAVACTQIVVDVVPAFNSPFNLSGRIIISLLFAGCLISVCSQSGWICTLCVSRVYVCV